ncbi:hypothetical protein Bbelb_420850 [Branchiostoma belcheri]|nr:hypothetical protein Bbelb_439970 [Branchiostoma belcheri]KAI8480166.1 hypothetical protein Bbelb_420850 [Branchiostoma belcheri]
MLPRRPLQRVLTETRAGDRGQALPAGFPTRRLGGSAWGALPRRSLPRASNVIRDRASCRKQTCLIEKTAADPVTWSCFRRGREMKGRLLELTFRLIKVTSYLT